MPDAGRPPPTERELVGGQGLRHRMSSWTSVGRAGYRCLRCVARLAVAQGGVLQYLPVHLIRLSADTAIGCNGTVGGAEGGITGVNVREEIISQLRLLPAPDGTSPAKVRVSSTLEVHLL
eukprot:scaffold50398_cov87-Phaeocystis_antarctica.AAC.1